MDSLWKVGVKHGWWKGIQGGDILVFVIALAVLNVVYELRNKAVEDKGIRLLVRVLRGDVDIALGRERQGQAEKKLL